MISIMLVDDHDLVRGGMKRILDEVADFRVVAEASTGEEALSLARELKPDCVLMDVNMPGMGGIEATRRLLKAHPKTRLIVVSMYDEEPYPSRMIAAGAVGYLSKDSAADEIVTAVRKVMNGSNYIAPNIAGNLAVSAIRGNAEAPFEQLSQREMQVMLMVIDGESTQEISDNLCLSPKTVSTYRYRLHEKLGVKNDVELTRLAMRHGLLEDKAEI